MAGQDFQIFRRDTVNLEINVYSDEAQTQAVDITGYKFWFTAKKNKTDTDTNATIQVSVTASSPSPVNNVSITLSKTDTDVNAGCYYYDIQMMDTSNQVTTFASGKVTIEQDITGATS